MTPLLFCLLLLSDLHVAARGGDIETVAALLAQGADVNEYD
jgi:ankyrin repeat protein